MAIDHRSNWYLRTSAQRYLPHGLKSWEVTIVDAYSTYTFVSPCMQHLCSLQARRLEARWEARDTTEKNEAPQTPPSFFLRPPAALITAPSSERLLVNDSNVLLHGSTRVYGGGSHLSLAHRTACGLTHAVRPRTRPHNLEDVLRLQSEHQRLSIQIYTTAKPLFNRRVQSTRSIQSRLKPGVIRVDCSRTHPSTYIRTHPE